MTAVSLNIGGGVRFIRQAKLYMCTQKHLKHNEDARTAPDVRDHGSERMGQGERRYELVGSFGFNGPLRQYFSLYRAVSEREGERGKKG